MTARGIRATPDVVINILTFEAPPPKKPKAQALDAKPKPRKRTKASKCVEEPEKKKRQEVLHIWYDDQDHVLYPGDALYQQVKNSAPGDRPRIIGRKNPRMGKLNYPQNTLA